MRRKDSKRIEDNRKVSNLLEESRRRVLNEDEIEIIKNMHTGYGGISNNTQFFTPEVVINYMLDSLEATGFKGGRILEPSCGNGKFVNALISKFENVEITSVELNNELHYLNKICYPNVNTINGDCLEYLKEFEGKFDLVIGNPPFGKSCKRDGFEFGKSSLESYFFELSLRALKEGGSLIMVLPDSILSSKQYFNLRKFTVDNFRIIQSISLPTTTFYFSGTSVKTSILHLKKKDCNNKDYSIFMGIVDKIGWDSKGNKNENELIPVYHEFKEFCKIEKDIS
ncbi:TPA: N-6 DNA methylase [Clostridioides difficile]|uniref:HsdM family class I SAM-dependent methyltransferase n=1 Tax=Clostridioides difficile TaxID=1496 RepID=UPI000BB1CE02|nr:N-6 DNA methylase [Clostridioides difficile]EGT3641065.1 restriction endonuclease [Clostridioides difficile]MBH7166036.1 N-6 DNA methylase [Clostridioides difficile]MBH7845750.1 N-6 DNA methylase [Clostridioides difficile]MBY1346618.1 SAM-dependent methyltransferase [Clostridioides difficile]MBY1662445.1 SAM-dependent methyltransferase [Clostridioides difficile]